MINKVAVLGLGKVGHLVAELLADTGFEVLGVDSKPYDPTFVQGNHLENTEVIDVREVEALKELLSSVDAVVTCLPYQLNIPVAEVAAKTNTHYFDLTEDVPTTQRIRELAETASTVMAPQCGLAPGFIGIVGADLASRFETCRSLWMRVGALPQHPTGLLGYAFNWSPEGVVNEYLNDCEIIEDGIHKWVSSMQRKETIFINGNELEAFTTSGGLGTICETYLGKIDNIDYKTIRYPGHVELMNFFFNELLLRKQRKLAGEILTHAKPPVDEDVVLVHVSAEGEKRKKLFRDEFVRSYLPKEILGADRTAIAWTTATSISAIVEMVSQGILPSDGFIKQEEIGFAPFLETQNGARYLTEF